MAVTFRAMLRSGVRQIASHSGAFDRQLFESMVTDAGTDPVTFVTVLGNYQTGKSTLLRDITRDCGFEVGNRYNSKTEGFRMCKKVFSKELCRQLGISDTGSVNQPVLFIDTEGLGKFEMTEEDEMRLLALPISISSVILAVVNENATIHEFDRLGIMINSSGNCGGQRTQKIILCVRTNSESAIGCKYKDVTIEKFRGFQNEYLQSRKQDLGSLGDDVVVCPIPTLPRSEDDTRDYTMGITFIAEEVLDAIRTTPRFVIEDFIRAMREVYPRSVLPTIRTGHSFVNREMFFKSVYYAALSRLEEEGMRQISSIMDTKESGMICSIISSCCDELHRCSQFMRISDDMISKGESTISDVLKTGFCERAMEIELDKLEFLSGKMLEEYESEISSCEQSTDLEDKVSKYYWKFTEESSSKTKYIKQIVEEYCKSKTPEDLVREFNERVNEINNNFRERIKLFLNSGQV